MIRDLLRIALYQDCILPCDIRESHCQEKQLQWPENLYDFRRESLNPRISSNNL